MNAVRPGYIYTEMHAKGGEPGRVDRVNGMVPMKRGGQPEEVAAASGYCQTKRRSSRAPFWMYQGDDEKQA